MSQNELAEIERRYRETKNRLQDLGFVIAGSVGERYLTCGKANCRCKADPPQRHGPYTEYTRKLAGKTKMKQALLKKVGLAGGKGVPVIGLVSRLTAQKGFDLLFDTLPEFLYHRDVRFVALGSGEERYESFLAWLQVSFPGTGRTLSGSRSRPSRSPRSSRTTMNEGGYPCGPYWYGYHQ
mgnify:CR=1 FL=1